MDRRLLLTGAGALVLAGGALGYRALRPDGDGLPNLPGSASAQSNATDADFARVPDISRGNPSARVKVIEYASFTCPHCANFHRNVYPQIEASYIAPGKIHYVKREVYFDRYGLWAAMVARCGDQNRYHAMVDLIYQHQREWAGSNDPAEVVENLRRLGRRSGLTSTELDACLNDTDQARAMVSVYQHHAARDEIRSTPSFVINGQLYSNMSYADFAAILDSKLGT